MAPATKAPATKQDVTKRHSGTMKLATYEKAPEQLERSQVRVNGGTQMRAGLNAETVADYAEAMTAYGGWGKFEPIVVYHDGSTYWLADGFHRLEAAKEAGVESVPAEIHAGDQRKAILHAAGANADHGLRRTNADKRRAVEMMLRDQEWGLWSQADIARHCRVTPEYVSRLKKELSIDRSIDSSKTVTRGAATYQMNTANIGAKAEPTPAPEPDDATVNQLQSAVAEWAKDALGSGVDSQLYYLDQIADGKNDGYLDRLVGNMKRVNGIDHYRPDDLIQAVKDVAQAKRAAQAARAAKKGPEAPSQWALRQVVSKWVEEKPLKPEQQHALLRDIRELEENHPDYAEMTALLPEHWRKRELKQALSDAMDSFGWKIGHDDWETHQLPSGRWYAQNKARNATATDVFSSAAEALAAVASADTGKARWLKQLNAIIHDPEFRGWQLEDAIKEGSPGFIAEIKLGLETLATQPEPLAYVAERLQLVEKKLQSARQLLEIAAPAPAAPVVEETISEDEQAAMAEVAAELAGEDAERAAPRGHQDAGRAPFERQPEPAADGLPTMPADLSLAGYQLRQVSPGRWAWKRGDREGNWTDAPAEAIDEARGDYQRVLAVEPMSFEDWLRAMPEASEWGVALWEEEGIPSLRQCALILALAQAAARRVRSLEPSLQHRVDNALPMWAQLVHGVEKAVKE